MEAELNDMVTTVATEPPLPEQASAPNTAVHTAGQTSSPVPQTGNWFVDTALALALAGDAKAVMLFTLAAVIIPFVLYRLILRPILAVVGGGGRGGGGVRRHTVLLVGLPSSGKTMLLQQLQAFDVNSGKQRPNAVLADTRTSMQPNEETILEGQYTVVDYPGHRRLRAGLFPFLRKAATVVVVIDSITVHDDKHEGAFAVAELLLSILPSPEFFGVKRLLFVSAKRDDMTAYSAKAVRRLLEKAMAASLQSQLGDLGRVDAVVDAKGGVVAGAGRDGTAKGGRGGRGGKGYVLHLEEDGSFDFDEQLDIPVEFVEVGCDIASGGRKALSEKLSVKSIVDFLSST